MAHTPMIYLIGSLRNPKVPALGNYLRAAGFRVFDDWFAAGEIADDRWQSYEKQRGHTYDQALAAPAAQHVFQFDLTHIGASEIGLLYLPAGKSGHLELGWMLGRGKAGYVLFDGEPERWDVMYNFAHGVFFDRAELVKTLQAQHLNQGRLL